MSFRFSRIANASAGAALVLLSFVPAFAQEAHRAVPDQIVDQRIAVSLAENEVAFVRLEMRGLLAGVQEVLEAASKSDRARLVDAARRAGMNGPEKDHIPPTLAPKLPQDFKKLGLAAHRAFDAIASDAPENGLAEFSAARLGALMTNCNACHATWRIVADAPR